MIKADFVEDVFLADKSNYTKGRNGNKVCKITPHMMGGILSAEQCCKNVFQKPERNASANYCIGNNGDIALCVSEENRAWTSSNRTNDYQAITIEVSNCERGGQWKISDKAWNTLVELCVDVCKRYNFRLTYDGTKNGSLTTHNMFANTDCAGPYLKSKMPELAKAVNSILDGQPIPVQPMNKKMYVNTKQSDLIVRDKPNGNKISSLPKGTEVNVSEIVLGWAKIGESKWVSASYLSDINYATYAQSDKYVLGKYKTTANLHVRSGAGINYKIKKTYLKGTVFDTYEIKGKWARTPSGWVHLDYAKLINKY